MKQGSVRSVSIHFVLTMLAVGLTSMISTNGFAKDFRVDLSAQSVVTIEPTDSIHEPPDIRSGSGFFVQFNDSVVLVTSYLRMQGKRFLWVERENGDRLQATHLRYDPYWGILLAMVDGIDNEDIQPLQLAEPSSTYFLNPGDRAEFVCGKQVQKERYVQGHILPKSEIRTGTPSALLISSDEEPTRYFGGGPVLNKRGEVMGMTLDRIDIALDPTSETKVVITSDVLRDVLSRIDAEPGTFEDGFVQIEEWYESWSKSDAGKSGRSFKTGLSWDRKALSIPLKPLQKQF